MEHFDIIEEAGISGNSKIKEEHSLKALSCIRRFGPVSRTEISSRTDISRPTITRIIDEFIKKGIVIETGILEATSKKKPVGLELNSNAFFSLGINVSRNTLRSIMADFKMNVIKSSKKSIKDIGSQEALIGAISDSIRYMLEQSGADRRKVLGIGIGILLAEPEKYAPGGVYIMRIHGTFVNFLDLSPEIQEDIIKRLDLESTSL